MSNYSKYINSTPQTERARVDQVQNNAGGYVFQLDKWAQLRRFLIIGTTGGTYYASEGKSTREGIGVLQACLDENGPRTVDMIVEISDGGKAPKNDPAIFALAVAASHKNDSTRAYALSKLQKVCRIGTHLFQFVEDAETMRRWGRGLRTAVSKWYTDKSQDRLAYQLVKYQQRNGWSNRDLLRLSHPVPKNETQDACFKWVTGKDVANGLLPSYIVGFNKLQAATTKREIVSTIKEYDMPRECVPTQWLNDPDVWDAMLPEMGLTALIRNLGKMTSIGLIKPLSNASKYIASKLLNGDAIRQQRLHPITTLVAMEQYRLGHGKLGSLRWSPDSFVLGALNEAFYLGFDAIEPTGQNYYIAIDCSGSMGNQTSVGLTARVVGAAMTMATVRSEPYTYVAGFTASGTGYGGQWGGDPSVLRDLSINRSMRLDDVVKRVMEVRMGGTDCSLPMLDASDRRLDVDTFIVVTDNETWAGNVQPFEALKRYRRSLNKPNAKLVVMATTATGFTIADPNDGGMLDVAGFSTDVPAVIRDFSLTRSEGVL